MSRLWLIAAAILIAATIAAVIGALIVLTRIGDADFASRIDDSEVIEVLVPACDRMTVEVEDLTVTGTTQEQAAIIEEQNAAISRMLTTIRELPTATLARDEPTIKWLLDWDALLQERSVYAAELERGHLPELVIPVDPEGEFIIERMDDAGRPDCVVPDALLDPYPVEVDEA